VNAVPRGLIYLRLACAPFVLVAAVSGWPGTTLIAIATLALLTDYFDGVVARRLHIDTAALRHFDSQADTVFYFAAGVGLFVRFPDAWRATRIGIGALIVAEVSRMVFEWRKFGRPAAYHMWSAKLWGVVMLAAFIDVALGGGGPLLLAAIVLGIYTNIEGMLASLILSEAHHDVPTWWHALRIARGG
jgi:phosphatidylglycerophosphate synthase